MNGPDHVFDPIRPLHALTNWPPAAPILPYPLVHTVTERVRRFETRPTSRLRRRWRPSRPMSRIENRTGQSWSKSWRTSRRYCELRNKRRALRPNILSSPFARSASTYIYTRLSSFVPNSSRIPIRCAIVFLQSIHGGEALQIRDPRRRRCSGELASRSSIVWFLDRLPVFYPLRMIAGEGRGSKKLHGFVVCLTR